MPKLNWMVTNAYNLRDTGVNGVQEAAFALSHAINIFELLCERGLSVDQFAPPFVVWSKVPLSPTAYPLLASRNRIA